MSSQTVDKLSRLPSELIDYIFELAHTREQPLTGALSKRLLPFFNRFFYREIIIKDSYKQLDLLCELSTTNSENLGLVKQLKIELSRDENEQMWDDPDYSTGDSLSGWLDDEEYTEEEEKPVRQDRLDARTALVKRLVELFRRLDSLEGLDLHGPKYIVCIPLENHLPLSANLTGLKLTTAFKAGENGLSSPLLESLSRFRQLSYSILNLRGLVPSPYPPSPTLLPKLVCLVIVSQPDAVPFHASLLASAPALHNFELHDDWFGETIQPLFPHILNPSLLRILVLDTDNEELMTLLSPQFLQSFENVKGLESVTLAVPRNPPLFDILTKAPLRSITFKRPYWVSIDDLKKLLKIKTLSEIRLDHDKATKGTAIPLLNLWGRVEITPSTFGWDLLPWTDDFSEEGLRGFLKLAQEENVEVTGTAVEALEVGDSWRATLADYDSWVYS